MNTLPIHHYDALLEQKVSRLSGLLLPFASLAPEVFASPKQHFRMRAEFGVWHEGFGEDGELYYTMMVADESGVKQRTRVDAFPIASEAINALMPRVLAAVKCKPVLKDKLFQVEFLSATTGDMLVTLIYHKPLDDDWLAAARTLEVELSCHLMGRARKQKLVLSQDFVLEQFSLSDKTYTYKQLEGGFTQPNARVCQHMLAWASTQASQIANASSTDLLELYCGNGNFTLPLSHHFRSTLATEISKTSVAAAQWNVAENDIDNINIARLSAEEFTQALNGERAFRRLTQAGVNLADYEFSTVFVDPPRAGIDDATLALLSRFDNIIYISCNPDTLADNLKTLCNTHKITASALFDQFPYTHHIEAGVVLKKPNQ